MDHNTSSLLETFRAKINKNDNDGKLTTVTFVYPSQRAIIKKVAKIFYSPKYFYVVDSDDNVTILSENFDFIEIV